LRVSTPQARAAVSSIAVALQRWPSLLLASRAVNTNTAAALKTAVDGGMRTVRVYPPAPPRSERFVRAIRTSSEMPRGAAAS